MDSRPDFIIKVSGMMCQRNCGSTVHAAIVQVPNVVSAVVSFEEGNALVWGHCNGADLLSAIEDVGFECYLDSDKSAVAKPVNSAKKPHLQANRFNIATSNKPTNPTTATSYLDCKVGGMSCAACVRCIEHGLQSLPGVCSVRIALLTANVEVTYTDAIINPSTILSTIQGLGYSVECSTTKSINDGLLKSVNIVIDNYLQQDVRDSLIREIEKLDGVVFCEMKSHQLMTVKLNPRISNCLGVRDLCNFIGKFGSSCHVEKQCYDSPADSMKQEAERWFRMMIISLFFGIPITVLHLFMSKSEKMMMILDQPTFGVGFKFYRSAFLGAKHGNFGMDCLIVVGTTITFGYSFVSLMISCSSGVAAKHTFFEVSGMLIMFVTIGKYLESFAKGSTVSAISSLLLLQPTEATLMVGDKNAPVFPLNTSVYGSLDSSNCTEVLRKIDLELVQRGDVLRVLPGERIPTDAIVTYGMSFVDESMITGEAQPVKKAVGDFVFGSTLNGNCVLHIQVKAVGTESALAQIVKLVELAQMDKAPIQDYADRVASIFTPAVLLLALVTFLVWISASWMNLIPNAWFDEEFGDPILFSMLFAISVVVISCPCALGLATPTAIMVGTSVGAQNGILIKGGSAFETAHKITALIFDKTGTLTCGTPTVSDILPVESYYAESGDSEDRKDFILKIAAMIEQHSEHPLARAVVNACKQRTIGFEEIVQGSMVHTGLGVEGRISIGIIRVGNRTFMRQSNISVASTVDAAMLGLETAGRTAVCVAVDDKICGCIGIMDSIKVEARSTLSSLRSMGIDVWMVTGDNAATAQVVADKLDFPQDRVLAGILPAGKAEKIAELQKLGYYVAMVGDGINDSPALAKADLGIAIGAGSQIALEAADMVLVRNNLEDVVVALDLARHVFCRIQWNFLWALCYNVVAIPFAAGLWFPVTRTVISPQYAGLSMALSSVSVVLSSMQLKCYRRPKIKALPDSESLINRFYNIFQPLRSYFGRDDELGTYEKLSTFDRYDVEMG